MERSVPHGRVEDVAVSVLNFPGAPAQGTKLCASNNISDPGSKGFEFGEEAQRFAMFVIRKDGQIFAYRDLCPHAGHPIDFPPDRFWSLNGKSVKCASHGALFDPQSGLCINGPCEGRSLLPVPIHQKDGDNLIGEPET